MRSKLIVIIAGGLLIVPELALGGNIDLVNSSWTVNSIALEVDGLRSGQTIIVTVYEDSTKTAIKRSLKTAAANAQGTIVAAIPAPQAQQWAVGDQVSVSDPDCALLSGTSALTDTPCSPPTALGACCDTSTNECFQVTEAECKVLGFKFRGDGAPCGSDGTCIPTLSEWGLAVMVLLVLTAATVVIMRRRAAVA